jgi:xanthine dehydrogenase small subunit
MQLSGRSVRTIEGLGSAGQLDSLQEAFLSEGAIQCGFCTPGLVMAGRALLDENPRPEREVIRRGLAGNLCRCTGYERIVRAVEKAAASSYTTGRPGTEAAPPRASSGAASDDETVGLPADLRTAIDWLARQAGEVTVVAGATDLLSGPPGEGTSGGRLLDVSRLPELLGVREQDGWLEIGAATTFAELARSPAITAAFPALATAAAGVGSPAIRNRATLGGNLVTASPCADSAPPLLALGAQVVLVSPGGRRELPLPTFITGYRQTARRLDELLVAVRIPRPAADLRQSYRKVGARRAQAIAKLSLAACARRGADGRLREVRLAAGSVAPAPLLLSGTMSLLEGRRLTRESVDTLAAAAAAAVSAEVRPITDLRSTAEYRRIVTARLVARFLHDLVQSG